jgi:hypothetical protein
MAFPTIVEVEGALTSWRAARPTNLGSRCKSLFEGVQSGRLAQQAASSAQIARALDFTVPRSLQVAADEVIQ